jgi:hypothetical protein
MPSSQAALLTRKRLHRNLEIRMSRKRNHYGSRLNGLIRSYPFLPFDNICVKMDGYCWGMYAEIRRHVFQTKEG